MLQPRWYSQNAAPFKKLANLLFPGSCVLYPAIGIFSKLQRCNVLVALLLLAAALRSGGPRCALADLPGLLTATAAVQALQIVSDLAAAAGLAGPLLLAATGRPGLPAGFTVL